MSHPKPNIIKAILSTILALLVFGLTYILARLIIVGIASVLSCIPIIGTLINSPDNILPDILPAAVAYLLTVLIIEKCNKNPGTQALTCSITGMSIIVVHILSLILNLRYNESIWLNIIQGCAGICLFSHGRSIRNKE